jgi:hypothetical protein
MSSTSIEISADLNQVASAHHLEIPIIGPGRANLLVIVDGIAIPDVATDEYIGSEDSTPFDYFIQTDYKLKDDDVIIDSSAYVTLSSIDADDSTNFLIALDVAEVLVKTTNVIWLHISGGFEGDTGLHRIGYQVNLVVSRTG